MLRRSTDADFMFNPDYPDAWFPEQRDLESRTRNARPHSTQLLPQAFADKRGPPLMIFANHFEAALQNSVSRFKGISQRLIS